MHALSCKHGGIIRGVYSFISQRTPREPCQRLPPPEADGDLRQPVPRHICTLQVGQLMAQHRAQPSLIPAGRIWRQPDHRPAPAREHGRMKSLCDTTLHAIRCIHLPQQPLDTISCLITPSAQPEQSGPRPHHAPQQQHCGGPQPDLDAGSLQKHQAALPCAFLWEHQCGYSRLVWQSRSRQ